VKLANEPQAGHPAASNIFVLQIAKPKEWLAIQQQWEHRLRHYFAASHLVTDPLRIFRIRRHDNDKCGAGIYPLADDLFPTIAVVNIIVYPHR
jgi:hypothetical protein